jgi:hypothetical protein
VDFSSVSELNNNPNAAFRIVTSFAGSTTSYQPVGSTSTYSGGGNIAFDMVTVTYNSILTPTPITCKSFSASYKNNKLKVDWIASCTNIAAYFEVERSKDGSNYTKLQKVNVRTLSEADYHIIDDNPLSGSSYYRLKMVDFDGKISYSKVARIKTSLTGVSLNNIFPNPVQNKLNIEWNAATNSNAQLIVTDIMGRLISKKIIASQDGFNTHSLDVNHLSRGQYHIQLIIENEKFLSKFSKY